LSKVGADGISIVAFIGKQSIRRALEQADQGVIGFAVCRLADRQVEGKWSSEGIS